MLLLRLALVSLLLCPAALLAADEDEGFVDLFPRDGAPKGWKVTEWNDLSKAGPKDATWTVKDGTLRTGKKRGSWLASEKTYGDFILTFEIKLEKLGNSGVALRAPLKGDPAFEGMELQVADLRYNTKAKADELTGAIYRSIAPKKQVYKPTEWNTVRIELKGDTLKVTLNGEQVIDTDLSKHDRKAKTHDPKKDAPALKDRPKKGHIGFQHLSRDNSPVLIRNAKIKELK
jgi:3-keto-disaccharide hydrolase